MTTTTTEEYISKLKHFIEVFNALTDGGEHDIPDGVLIDTLADLGKFSKQEAERYIETAIKNGQMYVRRQVRFLAKA